MKKLKKNWTSASILVFLFLFVSHTFLFGYTMLGKWKLVGIYQMPTSELEKPKEVLPVDSEAMSEPEPEEESSIVAYADGYANYKKEELLELKKLRDTLKIKDLILLKEEKDESIQKFGFMGRGSETTVSGDEISFTWETKKGVLFIKIQGKEARPCVYKRSGSTLVLAYAGGPIYKFSKVK